MAAYVYSDDRKNERPAGHLAGFRGVLQVDRCNGFKALAGARGDASVTSAFCWSHMRRHSYDRYVADRSPLAAEVPVRVRALHAIKADIRGHLAEHRRPVRQERSRPIMPALLDWLPDPVPRVSAASGLARAMRHAIRHWPGLVVFVDDGRVEMDTNVVERAIRPNTLTRKNALFAGSDGGARHWAVAMTLIQTAKLNGVDPMAWLADALEQVVSGKTKAHQSPRAHPGGDLGPVQIHALGVAPRQGQAGRRAGCRADRAEDAGRCRALILGCRRPGAVFGPAPGDLVLLADAGFVGEPDGVDASVRDIASLGARAAGGSLDAPCPQLAGQAAHPVGQHDAGLLAEIGISIPEGLERALTMARQVLEGDAPDVTAAAVKIIFALSQQALDTHSHVREIDRALVALQRSDDMARRLATIPGIGPIGATALAASVTGPGQFRSGRQFAAWLGLTPLQNSSGGKERLGRISKMGGKYLRRLLVIGATGLVRYAKSKPETAHPHRQSAGQKACAGGEAGDGQQNSADRVGGDDAWRGLSGRTCASIIGIDGRRKFS